MSQRCQSLLHRNTKRALDGGGGVSVFWSPASVIPLIFSSLYRYVIDCLKCTPAAVGDWTYNLSGVVYLNKWESTVSTRYIPVKENVVVD